MGRFRQSAAALCGIVAVAGILLGATYGYVARSFFHPETFATRVANGLARPEVARVVAEALTDQIIAMRRDLIAYRPIIVGSVERVVSAPPFRAVIRRAVKEAHEALISESGRHLTLTVADAGLIVRNTLAEHPQIAAKVPTDALTLLRSNKDRVTGERLGSILRIAQRVRTRSIVLLALGVLAGGLGFALSRRKDAFIMRCGLGISISAFVLAGVARFGDLALAAFAKSDLSAALVRGLWPTFVEPLAPRMLLLCGMGMAVVAGVTSSLGAVDLATIGRSAWAWLSAAPRSAWQGMLRALAFIAIGGVAAFHPAVAAEILMASMAGLLFFFGLQEAFLFGGRWLPSVEVAVAGGPGARWPRVVLATALGAILVGAGVLWLRSADTQAEVVPTIEACNGHPELLDRRFNEVALATSHNSMSAADISGWMFPNHEKGIRRQLEDGIRGFLIDVHYAMPVGDRVKTLLDNETAARAKYEHALGKEGVDAAMRIRDRLVGKETGDRDVYLCHGFCELGAKRLITALEEIKEFLVLNPNEVIVIVIQDEGVTPQDVAECFARSGLERLVYRGPVTPPWPTMRQMIASDQRVVVLAENQAAGVPWYHLAFEVCQETPYGFKDPSEFSNRPSRGGTRGSLLLMNHWIETTPTPLPSNAKTVNAYDFLLERARRCRRERGMIPNLVAVDFYATGDLVSVVDAINGVEQPGSPSAR